MLSGLFAAALAASMPAPEIRVAKVGSQYVLRLGGGEAFRTTSTPVRRAKTTRLSDGSVVGFWMEGEDSRYLVSRDGTAVLREQASDNELLLKVGSFDPLKSQPAVSALIPTPAENEVYIVQFKSQPMPGYLEELKAMGATVYDTVAPNGALVRIPDGSVQEVRNLGYVRWVGDYEATYRLDPALRAAMDARTLGPRDYHIWCNERGPAAQGRVADQIAVLGGRVIELVAEGHRMSANLTPVQLAQVLGMNDVAFVDERGTPSVDMDNVRAAYGGNFIETTLGFTGQGVRAEVMDGGLLATHVAWTNPPLQHTPAPATDSHGTSTFGINFGNGNANFAGRGMMPNAQGVIARYNAMSGGSRPVHTAQLLLAPYFCVYQSNSWGNPQTTQYTTISAEMDDILFRNDITILNSQSNTGNQTSRPEAWAKNVVSIGAIRHWNTQSTLDDTWGSGASIGPAADGRMKPDLCHYYDSVLTTTSSSTTAYTTGFGGTSAATPITAGHFGLFFQMWHNGVFGNAVPMPTVFDNRPKAPLAKAMMMNTANQYPLGPQQADITRWVQGFGSVHLTNVYNVRNNLFWVNETDVLQNLGSATYRIPVAGGTPALRITMAYTDPAGSPSPSISRKNNLSLRVVGPGGTSYWGNNGMVTSNWTVAGGAEDSLNTVEHVFIQNPPAGIYTVTVQGSDINTDARLETPAVIDADFALIATGVQNMNLAPVAFNVLDGGLVSGTLANLTHSDNGKIAATRGANGSRFFRSIVDTSFTSPFATATRMLVTVERQCNVPGVNETVQIKNASTGVWANLGQAQVGTVDGLSQYAVPSPQSYVSGTGAIELRCIYERQDEIGLRTTPINIDYVRIKVEP